ncbi:MAG: hypothetical protein ABMA64_33410 [Myxococcota bacterium]
MTRPARRIALLFTWVALHALCGVALPPAWVVALVGAELAVLWAYLRLVRTALRGRASYRRGDRPAGIALYRAFLVELEQRPWLRRLGWSLYTSDALALTWNNLGVGLMGSPGLDGEARDAFERAARLDPGYALPPLNLGLMAAVRGDRAAAAAHFAEATRLGYSDRAVQAAVRRAISGTSAAVEPG